MLQLRGDKPDHMLTKATAWYPDTRKHLPRLLPYKNKRDSLYNDANAHQSQKWR